MEATSDEAASNRLTSSLRNKGLSSKNEWFIFKKQLS